MSPELEQKLARCDNLPSPPSVALQVIELARDPEVGLAEVAQVIMLDPALVMKLLKTVNSPLYSLNRRIDNLKQALGLLGLNTTLTLALSFSLGQSLLTSGQGGRVAERCWRHSLISALACRVLARHLGVREPERYFLIGLLQDIGILALNEIDTQEYEQLFATAQDHGDLEKAERERFGSPHSQVGAWLLERWCLPEYLQLAVASSHNTSIEGLEGEQRQLVACSILADRLAGLWLSEQGLTQAGSVAILAQAWLGFDQARFSEILGDIAAGIPEIAKLFEAPLPTAQETTLILDQARTLLVSYNLRLLEQCEQARRQVVSISERSLQLEEENRRDPLTGLFNRRWLDRLLAEEFAIAKRNGWPLTLGFVDLDHFKIVNDTYGHQIGDQVLCSIARSLAGQVRQSDIVGRFGGEEFVVVLPGTDGQGGAALFGRILDELRALQHTAPDGQYFPTTASIGMVNLSKENSFDTLESLLTAADKALYQAKDNGRNQLAIYDQPIASGVTSLPQR